MRTVSNQNGYVISRTDHTAYGENIGVGVGLRSTLKGYFDSPDTRQGYGLTERDEATGLDHTWFRKNEGQAGRWTSPDPYLGSMPLADPHSFNRYSYVSGDPINFVDPSGLMRAVTTCRYELRTSYTDGGFDSVFLVQVCSTRYEFSDVVFDGGGSDGGVGVPNSIFIELLNPNVLNTCLEMLYGLKADEFSANVKLSQSGSLSTTVAETTYEANFSALEPGAKPIADLRMIVLGRGVGSGQITVSQARRDKEGDLNAMLYGLGQALVDPEIPVGNYEYQGGFRVRRPSTPSALVDCYRRYIPRS